MFITEIFKSIQGEGTRAGLPCIFVRLTGCNLRCTWCDTAYAFHGGQKVTDDEVKFVISSRKDYEFAREFSREHRLGERVREVLFSPVHDDPNGKWKGLEPRELVEWMLEDGLQVRLGLQLHKIVWDPAMRGV